MQQVMDGKRGLWRVLEKSQVATCKYVYIWYEYVCMYVWVCMHVCTHIKRSLQAVAKWLNKGKYIHHTHTGEQAGAHSVSYVCVCVRVSKRAQVLLLVPERSRRVCLRSIDSRSVV